VEAEITGRSVTIEIRSLNSRQLDLNLRIPGFYREKEQELRSTLSQQLERGKVDFILTTGAVQEKGGYAIDREQARHYYREIVDFAAQLGVPPPEDIIGHVLRMPDVVLATGEEPGEEEMNTLGRAIEQAIARTIEFRISEGRVLGEDMAMRVRKILAMLGSIEPLEKHRMTILREKLYREYSRMSSESGSVTPDQNRFEQELIFYLERLDITEEKVRLARHCDFFTATLNEPVSQGKKLGFITQEMGREINTIGSKASDADIQKIVVEMKDELEKIKEQLGNIL
jgi:uncharacterized protein (TIGR00255 family)